MIQKRYETFYLKEQLRLNKEEDLLEKRKKIQARNNFETSGYHCSQGSVLGAHKAMEDNLESKRDNYLQQRMERRAYIRKRLKQQKREDRELTQQRQLSNREHLTRV